MAVELVGPTYWDCNREDEGYKTYTIRHKVRAAVTDGPYNVMNTPGLPVIGAVWNFRGDVDPWAFCFPGMKVTPFAQEKDEPTTFWIVEQKFSNKPLKSDATVDDPLLEPPKVSGTFIKYQKEADLDKDGDPIRSSSFEKLIGDEVLVDYNRPAVRIEMNTALLGLSDFAQAVDRVNSVPMWGLPIRCVKLSNVSWERNRYNGGLWYYTRSFDFDVNYDTFDREIPDSGLKALNGHRDPTTKLWTLDDINGSPPDPTKPAHYVKHRDANGDLARTWLNGAGLPVDTDLDTNVGKTTFQIYREYNFFLLGIPATF